jgi:hypothetical protein
MYTTQQIADMFNVSRKTVLAFLATYPAFRNTGNKFGRDWLLTEDSIKWFKNRRKPGRPAAKSA